MVSHSITDKTDQNTLDTAAVLGMSFEQLTFGTELNGVPPAYMPTTTTTEEEEERDEHSPEDPLKPQTKRKARKRMRSLELPVFLMCFAFLLVGSVMVNQELYQTCVAVYNYNASDCEPLRGIIPKTLEAITIENRIQPYVAQISMINSILHNVWPGFLVLFIGPWSDKFGRRPILLTAFGAYFIGFTITATLVHFSEVLSLNPWFYLIGGLPSTLVGGSCSVMTIVFCYISDVCDKENKAKRMFYVDMAMGLGVVLGNVASSYLLRFTNAATVWVTSAALLFIAFIYIYCFIEESLDVEETTFSQKARRLFDVRLIRDLMKTCVARRPNYGRAIVGCTISIQVVLHLVFFGEIGVFYLFLRNKFNITLQEFSYYNASTIAFKMAGCALAFAIFRKIFKLPFAAIAMIGLASAILDHLGRALAQSFWQMYMANILGLLSDITGPMLQAIVALAVPSSELGKVYSLASCLKTLSPLLASPLYTYVYNRTLTYNPGLFNYISTGLCVECFFVGILINIYERRVANKSKETEAEKGETEKPEMERSQTGKLSSEIKRKDFTP